MVGVVRGVERGELRRLDAARFRQTLTAMRYSQVASADCPLKPREPAIRADEHVLREVAGVLVVADEPVAELIDLPLVPLHDHVERLAASGEARLDQRAVVGRRRTARPAARVFRRVRATLTFQPGRARARPRSRSDRAIDSSLMKLDRAAGRKVNRAVSFR